MVNSTFPPAGSRGVSLAFVNRTDSAEQPNRERKFSRRAARQTGVWNVHELTIMS